MLTKSVVAKLICFGISIVAFSSIGKAQESDKTCNVWQVCQSNSDATPDNPPTQACQDPNKVSVPIFWPDNYAP